MDFLLYISTDTGFTEDEPLVTPLDITRGRLTGGFVYFPSGPAGTLHFFARLGLHQIVPFNTGQNYRLNDCVVSFSLGIDIDEPPFLIDCVTWNDSELFPHALTVCFFLDPSFKRKFSLQSFKKEFNGINGYQKP